MLALRNCGIAELRNCALLGAMVLGLSGWSSAQAASEAGAAAQAPTAVIATTAGTLACTLFPEKAPKAVANFVELARGTRDWTDPRTGQKKRGVPLYNGTIFHRVIPGFMIQGGDPLGTGTGGPGYKLPDDFSPDLKFDKPGMMAYANTGANSNGSQFFITEVPTGFLDPCLDAGGCTRGARNVPRGYGYTIFGQCPPEAVELVKKIARMPRDTVGKRDGNGKDRPYNPVKITSIHIEGIPSADPRPAAAAKAPARKPTAKQ